MNRATQSVVLVALGAMLLRLSVSSAYLSYVKEWIRFPLLVSGGVLVVLAMACTWWHDESPEGAPAMVTTASQPQDADVDAEESSTAHPASRAAWLLLLPIFVVFVIGPPALGSFVADRQGNRAQARLSSKDKARIEAPASDAPSGPRRPVPMRIFEFVGGSQYDFGRSVRGRPVTLVGFVSGKPQHWYVSRISISCCAADATAYSVHVVGQPQPAKDSWVRVTGVWIDPDHMADPLSEDTDIQASQVQAVPRPKNTYE